ncbi:MAG: class I SAM-dependent methyltransferase [Gammaproteobacteria bacterium]|nr:class I SAM-dependent methyltransferase [Gammaproteobacteria bacterium]
MKNYPLKFYFKQFRLHLKLNGILWTLCYSIRHVLVEGSRLTGNLLERLERKYDLPGSNSVEENALKWNHYSWSRGEDEWSESEQWKESIIQHVMLKLISPGATVLEIGPGYGRWTRKLIEISVRLIAVDVTEKCVEHCKKLFGDFDNAEFHLNDGQSLAMVADQSIDFVWSFDVFVHIEPSDIAHYLQEFKRVLKDGGVAILHHGIAGRTDFTWRSSLTQEQFADLLEEYDFRVIEQFSSWGENQEFSVASSDAITIFTKN